MTLGVAGNGHRCGIHSRFCKGWQRIVGDENRQARQNKSASGGILPSSHRPIKMGRLRHPHKPGQCGSELHVAPGPDFSVFLWKRFCCWSKGMMGAKDAATFRTTLCSLLLLSLSCECLAAELNQAQTALLEANTSWDAARNIPQTLFGLFFEEINHAGAGGIWAELVSNRGFEAGGPNTPSNI